MANRPRIALTQGDPAGIGPELLLRLVARGPHADADLVVVAERSALEAVRGLVPEGFARLCFDGQAGEDGMVRVVDPVAERRTVTLGQPTAADADGAMAALDEGIRMAQAKEVDAVLTLPVSKSVIARHRLPTFRGHTDYLAEACGLERYGRDYLMAFLSPDLQVALLTVHEPLRRALDDVSAETVLDALGCLERHAGGRIALAGLNPHAGEDGLLGSEEIEILRPAVEDALARGWDVHGPESPDSVFVRARGGAFDWVLALYHDQGLIAVKTAAFGEATNWTLGLPFLRTSVDHGTAFGIAGQGKADPSSLFTVLDTTVKLAAGELPRRR